MSKIYTSADQLGFMLVETYLMNSKKKISLTGKK